MCCPAPFGEQPLLKVRFGGLKPRLTNLQAGLLQVTNAEQRSNNQGNQECC